MRYYERYKWLATGLLCLVVLATAIYAVTTWSTTTEESINPRHRGSSQLPDQSNMIPSLQAQPTNQNLNGGGSSSSLQSGTGTQQGSQSSGDVIYPANPDPCRGIEPADGSQPMCMAQ